MHYRYGVNHHPITIRRDVMTERAVKITTNPDMFALYRANVFISFNRDMSHQQRCLRSFVQSTGICAGDVVHAGKATCLAGLATKISGGTITLLHR